MICPCCKADLNKEFDYDDLFWGLIGGIGFVNCPFCHYRIKITIDNNKNIIPAGQSETVIINKDDNYL